LRVCLYSHAFSPSIGGIETVSELLAEYLLENGMEVSVVTQTPCTHPDRQRYRVVRRPNNRRLRQIVREHDLLHANGMSVRAVAAAARCGVPVIVTHQSYNAGVPRSFAELRRMVKQEGVRRLIHALASAGGMYLAHTNVCISRYVLKRVRPPRALVIYNPIGRVFRPLPEAPRNGRFAFVGRLVSDKGCDLLLRALAECGRRGCRPGLDIYGEGPQKPTLEALADAVGLSGQVGFRGSVRGESLAEAYRESLAVVVPSVWEEPLGIVALEAMACGRAVIASAGGGLGEVVEGVGLTFPNGDLLSLAECLVRLFEDPGLRTQLERRAITQAERFSIDAVGTRYLALYRAALEESLTAGELMAPRRI